MADSQPRLPPFINNFFALMEAKNFSQAENLARGVIAQAPNHYVGHHLLGTALRFQRRFPESERELREAIRLWPHWERTPDYAAAFHQLGLLYHELRKFDLALQALERSVTAAPDLVDAQMGLGYLLKEMKGHESALQHTRQALQLLPREPKLYLLLGELLGETGRNDEASKAFQTAAQLAPGWAMPWYDLAALRIRERRYRDAESYVREAVRREPQNEEFRALLRSVTAWADWGTPAGASIWSRTRFKLSLDGYPARDMAGYEGRDVPRIPVANLDRWRDIIDRLSKITPEHGHLVYRGQIQDWRMEGDLSLQPALLRTTRPDEEIEKALALWRSTLEPFLGNLAHGSLGALIHKEGDSAAYVHPPPFSKTGRLLELIYSPELGGTMQHYGFPTDFLDVTRDPNVALWFALHCAHEDAGRVVTYSQHKWSSENRFDDWPSIYVIYLPRWQMVDLTDGCISQFASLRVSRQKAALASCLLYDEPGLKPIPHFSVHAQIHECYPDVVFILKLEPGRDWARAELPQPVKLFPSDDEIYQALLQAGAEDVRRYQVESLGSCLHQANPG